MNRQVEIKGKPVRGSEKILTGEALDFVAELVETFRPKHAEILLQRALTQKHLDAGMRFRFNEETERIRTGSWRVWPVPKELEDRRVEITGPAGNRGMVINALNSGANVFMADAEDSESPTWENILNGQINLADAIRRQIDFTDEAKQKTYRLKEKTAVLFFRPRGWHLYEQHLTIDDRAVPASLFDFGLYMFHNAEALLASGHGPYFYLPKMESATEARLWNEVFDHAERRLGCMPGMIKATVLIETLPAAFQMHEILYELRSHSAGLNCGRWDYIFSYIKKMREHGEYVLPERGQLTMDKGFLASYVKLLIETCHKRGAHAMGGMAAQIPVKGDTEEARLANADAIARVKADKTREVKAGHDGTWVAHPALVPVAKEIFDLCMPGPNQLQRTLPPSNVTPEDLCEPIRGAITEAGVKKNLAVGIEYLWHWLRGTGAAAINNLMEDAATAEISRVQLWQWLKHRAVMDDGRVVNSELIGSLMAAVYHEAMADSTLNDPIYEAAADLFLELVHAPECEEFLTIPAYEMLLESER